MSFTEHISEATENLKRSVANALQRSLEEAADRLNREARREINRLHYEMLGFYPDDTVVDSSLVDPIDDLTHLLPKNKENPCQT